MTSKPGWPQTAKESRITLFSGMDPFSICRESGERTVEPFTSIPRDIVSRCAPTHENIKHIPGSIKFERSPRGVETQNTSTRARIAFFPGKSRRSCGVEDDVLGEGAGRGAHRITESAPVLEIGECLERRQNTLGTNDHPSVKRTGTLPEREAACGGWTGDTHQSVMMLSALDHRRHPVPLVRYGLQAKTL